MPLHRIVLLFTLLTLLGLVAVYLQIQRVQIGYRVSQEETRAGRLREAVRAAELNVHRRRDLAALQDRARMHGTEVDLPAAGRIVLVAGRGIRTLPPPPATPRLAAR
jgi:hypothetical protein